MYNSADDRIQTPLKMLIARDFASKYGFTPELSEIYLTVGGIGGLFAALMSILDRGDEVIYFDPSYPLHLSQTFLAQAKPVFVSLIEKKEWQLDLEKLKRSISGKTKAIILTNPNNPTGTILTEAQIEALAEVVISKNLYLVLDEAYEYLTFNTPVFSPAKIAALRPRLILSRSFSKEYAMTGWRIGYLWAPGEIIKKIHNVHLYFSINPATISIVAATIVMQDPRGKQALNSFREQIKESRTAICRRMDKLKGIFSYTKPQGAFYLFPKILLPGLSAIDFAKKLIEEAGVTTIPGDSMGPSGKGHLRLSFSANSALIHKAFDRIDGFAKKYRLT